MTIIITNKLWIHGNSARILHSGDRLEIYPNNQDTKYRIFNKSIYCFIPPTSRWENSPYDSFRLKYLPFQYNSWGRVKPFQLFSYQIAKNHSVTNVFVQIFLTQLRKIRTSKQKTVARINLQITDLDQLIQKIENEYPN